MAVSRAPTVTLHREKPYSVHMREHSDFGKMKGERNPYVKALKQPIAMRLDKATVAYFKSLATELGMPYQNLINLYLRDRAQTTRSLS